MLCRFDVLVFWYGFVYCFVVFIWVIKEVDFGIRGFFGFFNVVNFVFRFFIIDCIYMRWVYFGIVDLRKNDGFFRLSGFLGKIFNFCIFIDMSGGVWVCVLLSFFCVFVYSWMGYFFVFSLFFFFIFIKMYVFFLVFVRF